MNISDLHRRVSVTQLIPNEFIITVKTDFSGTRTVTASNQIMIPIRGTDIIIDWGDGSSSVHTQTGLPNGIIGGNNVIHTYASAGIYDIKISPTFDLIRYNNTADADKLLFIKNWGKATWNTSLANTINNFRGCTQMDLIAKDIPDFGTSTRLDNFFSFCTSLQNLNNSINNFKFNAPSLNLSGFFNSCTVFNQPLDKWNTSNVSGFGSFLAGCSAYNQSVNHFDLSSVTTSMAAFFQNATSFNQPLDNWVFNNSVNNFQQIFQGAVSFNQDISMWNLPTSATNFLFTFSQGSTSVGLSVENYSRLLISYANQVFLRGAPLNTIFTNQGGRRYNNIQYTTGNQFNDAVSARDYLINTAGWSITDGGQI